MTPFNEPAFRRAPLVGILRNFPDDLLAPVVEAFLAAGLTTLEITLNTPNAFEQIRRVQALAQNRLNIGAGTVTSPALLHQALEVGVSYIVTPNLNPLLARTCAEKQIPFFPGAWSPSEILMAHELGATAVKVFPSDTLPTSYYRHLRTQFPHISLMPTGGVSLQTLPELLHAGATAFGIGSPFFPKHLLQEKDWSGLEKHLKSFLMTYQTHRNTL